MTTAKPIEPTSFEWFDYHGFTFSLGLEIGGHVINSGHSGSAFDPEKGKPDVSGSMTDQARVAYAKQAAVLAGAGLSMAEVTRVVENVTRDGIAHYGEAEQVRAEIFGDHQPVVVTVLVDRLVRRKALIEVEVHASPPGEAAVSDAVAPSSAAEATPGVAEPSTAPSAAPTRWHRELTGPGRDGEVYLPTLLPIDEAGDVVCPGDVAGQYRYCLDRAGELLGRQGLSLANLVMTVDYTTLAGRADYRSIDPVRRELLGPVYPASAGILMTSLHEPGVLVALDAIASRRPLRAVNPGWSRYDTLTYQPAIRTGDMLYLSGFAALDMTTGEALHPQDLRGQAEAIYDSIEQAMAAAGATQLLSTVEYVTPDALPDYRQVADVRRERLREPYPASTGIVCGGLLREENMMEVVATALITDGDA